MAAPASAAGAALEGAPRPRPVCATAGCLRQPRLRCPACRAYCCALCAACGACGHRLRYLPPHELGTREFHVHAGPNPESSVKTRNVQGRVWYRMACGNCDGYFEAQLQALHSQGRRCPHCGALNWP